MFTTASTGAAKRLYIQNVLTDEIIVSNTMEISNEFSIENRSNELSTVEMEYTVILP